MSSDPESNLADLEQRVANVLSSAHECLELLVSPPEGLPRFVVAERLLPLGSLLVPGLLEVLTSGEADDENFVSSKCGARPGEAQMDEIAQDRGIPELDLFWELWDQFSE